MQDYLGNYGKIGVAVGFILGNILLTYVANGTVEAIIHLKEIIIASIALLVIPKNIEIKLEDIIGTTKALPSSDVKALNKVDETVEKLNCVSETFENIAKNFEDAAVTVDEQLTYEDVLEFGQAVCENTCTNCNKVDVCLRETLMQDMDFNTKIINELTHNEVFEIKDLEVLASNGLYCAIPEELVKGVNQVYNTYQTNSIWELKYNQSRKTVSTQLRGISKIISSVAGKLAKKEEIGISEIKAEIVDKLMDNNIKIDGIDLIKQENSCIANLYTKACSKELDCFTDKVEEILSKSIGMNMILDKKECGITNRIDTCMQKFVSKKEYTVNSIKLKRTKDNNAISGDTCECIELENGKYGIILSDGMGSGKKAANSSKALVESLSKMLKSGFSKDAAMQIINSTMILEAPDDSFATLDLGLIDLYDGNIEIMKQGAMPTYIKLKDRVDVIDLPAIPAGIMEEMDIELYDKKLEKGSILVMVTDGIIESAINQDIPWMWLKDLLEKVKTDDIQKIANIIMTEAIDNNAGLTKDDMTIVIAKIE